MWLLALLALAAPCAARVIACVGDSITFGAMASDVNHTYPAQLEELLGPGTKVLNFGVSGRTAMLTGDSYRDAIKWPLALESQADVFVVGLGTNDGKAQYWTPRTVPFNSSLVPIATTYVQQYATLVQQLRALPQSPRVFVAVPIPQLYVSGKWPDMTIINDDLPDTLKAWAAGKLQTPFVQGSYLVDFRTGFLKDGLPDKTLYTDGIHPNDAGFAEIANAARNAIDAPTQRPTTAPTTAPTQNPTPAPASPPTPRPTTVPTEKASEEPTHKPTHKPTHRPTFSPTYSPSYAPSFSPSYSPSYAPSPQPTPRPTHKPTPRPTRRPTRRPTPRPTPVPTDLPTAVPTAAPTALPTAVPTAAPSAVPTQAPTLLPTAVPTQVPTTPPKGGLRRVLLSSAVAVVGATRSFDGVFKTAFIQALTAVGVVGPADTVVSVKAAASKEARRLGARSLAEGAKIVTFQVLRCCAFNAQKALEPFEAALRETVSGGDLEKALRDWDAGVAVDVDESARAMLTLSSATFYAKASDQSGPAAANTAIIAAVVACAAALCFAGACFARWKLRAKLPVDDGPADGKKDMEGTAEEVFLVDGSGGVSEVVDLDGLEIDLDGGNVPDLNDFDSEELDEPATLQGKRAARIDAKLDEPTTPYDAVWGKTLGDAPADGVVYDLDATSEDSADAAVSVAADAAASSPTAPSQRQRPMHDGGDASPGAENAIAGNAGDAGDASDTGSTGAAGDAGGAGEETLLMADPEPPAPPEIRLIAVP
ncbi:hypothetical protein M885DRAFT_518451 [Pelagophyceae sp. CCMP2097]|nr:hypothetical protein M885DRAFT_518451 [Pelagophyceae sp. CCMP2097]